MILLENAPQRSLYLLGAKFISTWKESGQSSWRVTEAYEAICEKTQISFSVFMLVLDWLFLIQLLELTNDGKLKRCS